MKPAGCGPIDRKDRILAPVLTKVVRTALDPSLQNRLMPIVVVATTKDHLLLEPNQMVLERESRPFEGLDEPGQ